MIGRMYRPLKILNIPGKRGFNILNKYKSNFGGTYKFETEIYLDYNDDEKRDFLFKRSEVVHINFKDLTLPVYIEEGIALEGNKAISSNDTRIIESVRRLIRPTKISSKDVLEYVMVIDSSKDENEKDLIEMYLVPFIKDGQEYMKIEVKCKTPVVVSSSTSVVVAE